MVICKQVAHKSVFEKIHIIFKQLKYIRVELYSEKIEAMDIF